MNKGGSHVSETFKVPGSIACVDHETVQNLKDHALSEMLVERIFDYNRLTDSGWAKKLFIEP